MKQRNLHPSVSVVLCTYNRRTLLPRAIQSVFDQSYTDWELIIVDDGSTDDSASIIRPYTLRDSRVHYYRQENCGLASARNTGLALSRGIYVTFLDSDDEYLPDHLEQCMKFLSGRTNVDGIYGRMKLAGPRSRHYVPDVTRPGKKIHLSRCHAAGTLVAKRRCLEALGGFRQIPFSEDFDLIRRLEEQYTIRTTSFKTYVYHAEADNRLCDLFEQEGVEGILRYRNTK